jgi:hypothetical protein
MNSQAMVMTSRAEGQDTQPVRIRAHGAVTRRLGHWTSSREFDVLAARGVVTLDLRSMQIPPGDIEIHLDIDHAVVRLLVPDGAIVDSDEVRRVGRCRVKDWMAGTAGGRAGTDGGRRIVLAGEMRHGEVRVYRGGIAILAAMASREYLADARRARREGRLPTTCDPSR